MPRLIIDAKNIYIPIEKVYVRDARSSKSPFILLLLLLTHIDLLVSFSHLLRLMFVRSFAYALPNRILHGSIRTISMRNDVRSYVVLNNERQRRRRRITSLLLRPSSASYNHFDTFKRGNLDNSMINDVIEIH